jgi:hypothetical protein
MPLIASLGRMRLSARTRSRSGAQSIDPHPITQCGEPANPTCDGTVLLIEADARLTREAAMARPLPKAGGWSKWTGGAPKSSFSHASMGVREAPPLGLGRGSRVREAGRISRARYLEPLLTPCPAARTAPAIITKSLREGRRYRKVGEMHRRQFS